MHEMTLLNRHFKYTNRKKNTKVKMKQKQKSVFNNWFHLIAAAAAINNLINQFAIFRTISFARRW